MEKAGIHDCSGKIYRGEDLRKLRIGGGRPVARYDRDGSTVTKGLPEWTCGFIVPFADGTVDISSSCGLHAVDPSTLSVLRGFDESGRPRFVPLVSRNLPDGCEANPRLVLALLLMALVSPDLCVTLGVFAALSVSAGWTVAAAVLFVSLFAVLVSSAVSLIRFLRIRKDFCHPHVRIDSAEAPGRLASLVAGRLGMMAFRVTAGGDSALVLSSLSLNPGDWIRPQCLGHGLLLSETDEFEYRIIRFLDSCPGV